MFKNTLPTKLYWILFPIENLRQAVDTAKRILTKEKLDKQLTGQTSTSPFMSNREGTDKRVSFNARDELGDKIDKLTMVMSKLAATDSHETRPFRPQIYKSRGQNRSYNQGEYQPRSNDRNRNYGSDRDTIQNYRGNRSRGSFRGITDKIVERGIEIKGIVITVIEIEIDQGREHLQETIEETEVLAMTDLDQGLEQVQTGIE